MSASEFIKKYYVVAWLAGFISALLATRFDPFKSNFSLAILTGVAVGVICTLAEVAIRGIAKKLNRATHSSGDGPGV